MATIGPQMEVGDGPALPDHCTLIAISNGSNFVAFIDTASNKVKGITCIVRSPH